MTEDWTLYEPFECLGVEWSTLHNSILQNATQHDVMTELKYSTDPPRLLLHLFYL